MLIIEKGILTACNGESESVVIPETVTEIGDFAFEGNTNVKNIVVPDSVTEIGRGAFANCKSLEKVRLPRGLNTLEINLFTYCTALKSIEIPKSVKYIKRLAFYGCESLARVELPNGVSVIGANTFSKCESLEEVILPPSLTRIGDMAFGYCKSLKSVTLSAISVDPGAEIFRDSASDLRISYGGSSDELKQMVTAERQPRPWETIGAAEMHQPIFRERDSFIYKPTPEFRITVTCEKDGKTVIFQNANH